MQTSVCSLHESTEQATPSLQSGGVPAWQSSVALQLSTPVQNRVSSHAASTSVCTQTPNPSQRSLVQPTPSSVQTVETATKPSPGHESARPSQLSARSHSPADARQTVPATSIWQVAEQQSPAVILPSSQVSPTSTTESPQAAIARAGAPSSTTAVVTVTVSTNTTCRTTTICLSPLWGGIVNPPWPAFHITNSFAALLPPKPTLLAYLFRNPALSAPAQPGGQYG